MNGCSVILPCRDAAETLPETIASLEAQTFRDYEVFAIDDGSRDATSSLLRAWAARHDRVHVITQKAGGIVAALQRGVAASSGPIIARMDADDVADPRRLELQLRFLREHAGVAACGTGVRYFPDEYVRDGARRYEQWLNAIRSPADVACEMFVECPLAHPSLCIRRAALAAVGGYQDHGWPEDYDLVLRLFAGGHALANVPDMLLHWRERPHRASRTDPRYSADAFRRCKVHYLKRTLLRERDGAVVWGAGPVGKAFARELIAQGVSVRAFVDLDRRKIGQTIHGAPVVEPGGIDTYSDAFIVAAVGQPRAREEIRAALRGACRVEGVDFCAVA